MPFFFVQYLNHVQLFCNPMDCSLLGFSDHEISQIRILECVAISFFKVSSRPRDQMCLLHRQADSLPVRHLGSPRKCPIYMEKEYVHMYVCIYTCVRMYMNCMSVYIYIQTYRALEKKIFIVQWRNNTHNSELLHHGKQHANG